MTDKPSLSELADALERANANFETAKANEAAAVSARKKAALEQSEAREAFNDAIAGLKKKRKSPTPKAAKAAPKPAAPKKAA